MNNYKLEESELILNTDGSVYHLGLRPQDISKTIVTVGDPERVSEVSKHFSHIRLKKSVREFHAHTGTYQGKEITVISTGIGTDNVDIVINELDALVNIDLEKRELLSEHTSLNIIRLGTSGSIDAHIAPDQVLLSQSALGFDGLMHFYPQYEHMTTHQSHGFHAYWSYPNAELLAKFESLFPLKGNTLTATGFYAPQGRSIRLQSSLKQKLDQGKMSWNGSPLHNIEMETSGIYSLCHLLGHKALSINALLANRINGEFSKQPKKTVEDMIVASLELIAGF